MDPSHSLIVFQTGSYWTIRMKLSPGSDPVLAGTDRALLLLTLKWVLTRTQASTTQTNMICSVLDLVLREARSLSLVEMLCSTHRFEMSWHPISKQSRESIKMESSTLQASTSSREGGHVSGSIPCSPTTVSTNDQATTHYRNSVSIFSAPRAGR